MSWEPSSEFVKIFGGGNLSRVSQADIFSIMPLRLTEALRSLLKITRFVLNDYLGASCRLGRVFMYSLQSSLQLSWRRVLPSLKSSRDVLETASPGSLSSERPNHHPGQDHFQPLRPSAIPSTSQQWNGERETSLAALIRVA